MAPLVVAGEEALVTLSERETLPAAAPSRPKAIVVVKSQDVGEV
jgi:hypothetical protein